MDLVGFEDICDERVLFDFCGGCAGESINIDPYNLDPHFSGDPRVRTIQTYADEGSRITNQNTSALGSFSPSGYGK